MARPYIGPLVPKTQPDLGNPYAAVMNFAPGMYGALHIVFGAGDLSGNNRHGLIFGSAVIGGDSSTPLASGGMKTTAFDGSDDRIGSKYAPFSSGAIRSVGGWFYRANTTNTHTFFGGDNNPTMPTAVALSGGTDIRWRTQNNSATAVGIVGLLS